MGVLNGIVSGLLLSFTSLPQLLSYATALGSPSPLSSLPQASLPLVTWAMLSSHPALLCGLTAVTSAMGAADLDIENQTFNSDAEYNILIAAYS